MKKLFIASLVFFWTGTVALLVAGIMMYSETKPAAQSGTQGEVLDPLANSFDSLGTTAPSDDDIFVVVGTSTDASSTDSASSPGGASYTTEIRTVEKPRYLTAAIVAQHATQADCWFIVDNKVYDVTEYIPFHPGGEGTIVSNCGKDASVAFATKGGGGSHSASAKALLAKYYKGTIGDAWGTVSVTEEVRVPVAGGTTPTASAPSTGTTPAATVKGKFAAGTTVKVTGTVRVRQSPATTGALVGTADVGLTGKVIGGPTTAGGYTWYNIEYSNGLKGWSVQDYLATSAGTTVATTPTTPTTPAPTATQCTSWTYNSWGSCQSNGTQTRTVKAASPSGCTGGKPVTSQSCTYVPPAASTGLTTSVIATHSNSGSCWLIISNKVYDVTQYIPFHPGGQSAITNYCGKDATTAFGNKGGGGSHSASAKSMLTNYYVGDVAGAAVTTPTTPVTGTQCASFTYNSWGSCQSNGTQSRTIKTSTPSGCTGGTPVTTQSCTYVPPTTTPPATSGSLTTSVIATHNTSGSCWLIISNKVYDVTQYIPFHPGGQSAITNYCGKEATNAFNTKGGGGSHSSSAQSLLSNYYIGDVSTGATTPTTPTATQCTSWTYSSWGSCQPSGTQTRTINTSSPSGCTGGSPVTVQACTYTPPTPPPTSGSLTSSVVATHNTSGSCWLIISNKVYDVTQYIPFHPGGQTRIINNCGKDATTVFTTNVSGGHRHSTSATNLLAGYYVGDLVTTPTQCTTFTYSAWGTCQSDSTQTRTVQSSSPSGCTGGSPITSQSCTYVAPDPNATQCTAWTYSSWGTCQSDSTQTRTVQSSSPSGCTGGSPVTTQSCTYTPPAVSTTYDVTVNSSGVFNQTSLTIAVGDKVRFTYTNPGDEVIISFSPAGISSMKLDHDVTSKTATFSTAGTWTFRVQGGGSGTITVQ